MLVLFAGASAAQEVYAYREVSDPVEVRLAGKKATLQVVLIKGGEIVDEAPSSMCSKRIEGTFAVKVKFDKGKAVYTPLNNLMTFNKKNTEKLAFCAKPWKIVTADYNRDGQIDFNLGQYANSNGWAYWFFTISPSGHASLLPVPNDFIFLADDKNSTNKIKITDEGIKTVAYANACDKPEDCGWWQTTYRWNIELKRFEQHDSKHLTEYSPAEK